MVVRTGPNKKHPKTLPDDPADRLQVCAERVAMYADTLPPPVAKVARSAAADWIDANQVASALGITLSKRDYRNFMMARIMRIGAGGG